MVVYDTIVAPYNVGIVAPYYHISYVRQYISKNQWIYEISIFLKFKHMEYNISYVHQIYEILIFHIFDEYMKYIS